MSRRRMTTGTSLDSVPQKSFSRLFRLLWLVLLFAVAAFVRIYGMADWHLNADEAAMTRMAEGRTLAEVWQFSHYEAPAPLANLLRHYWIALLEASWFVRLEPLLFGLALIPVYYGIGMLLGGELCAMACGALIAFSHGGVIHSTIVRNYCFFNFFISATFYSYLKWRTTGRTRVLAGYAVLGCLSAFINICTGFTAACIAPVESLRLWRHKAPLRLQALWLLVNGAIFLAAAFVYVLWKPLLTPLASYFVQYHLSGDQIIPKTLYYPLSQAGYALPSEMAGLVFLVCLMGSVWKWRKKTLALPQPFLFALTFLSFGLGMVLLATNIYPYVGTRRGLWAMPFIVSTAGVMIAYGCGRMFPMTGRKRQGLAMAFILAGGLFYSSEERFRDGSEYALPNEPWNAASRYLETVKPTDLVVTERDDGQLLANLYRPAGDDAFSGRTMVALAPYRGTRILYNPYYPRSYSRAVFLANLSEARDRGVLDGIDTIIFFRTAWSRSPLGDLMLCPALEKTVLTFPPLPQAAQLTRDDIYKSYLSVMIVTKKALLEDVLSEGGGARACLNGKHDQVPGFQPIHPINP